MVSRRCCGRLKGQNHLVVPNLKVKEVVHQGVHYVICLNPEEQERDRRVLRGGGGKVKREARARGGAGNGVFSGAGSGNGPAVQG